MFSYPCPTQSSGIPQTPCIFFFSFSGVSLVSVPTVFQIVLGLMPFLDNFAHIGGLMMGFLIGLGLLVQKTEDGAGEALNKKCYQVQTGSCNMRGRGARSGGEEGCSVPVFGRRSCIIRGSGVVPSSVDGRESFSIKRRGRGLFRPPCPDGGVAGRRGKGEGAGGYTVPVCFVCLVPLCVLFCNRRGTPRPANVCKSPPLPNANQCPPPPD